MKVLIVCPKFPKTLGGFANGLKMFARKASIVPKEILKVSILLPITWERKKINLNTKKLKRKDILWADLVIVNACEEQCKSTNEIIKKCNSLGKKIVACGSLFTEYFEEFENVEHLVLDDIRKTLPQFINDIEENKTKKVYHSNPLFEIRKFSEPYYSLANISDGLSQNIQLSHA